MRRRSRPRHARRRRRRTTGDADVSTSSSRSIRRRRRRPPPCPSPATRAGGRETRTIRRHRPPAVYRPSVVATARCSPVTSRTLCRSSRDSVASTDTPRLIDIIGNGVDRVAEVQRPPECRVPRVSGNFWKNDLTHLQFVAFELHKNAFDGRAPPRPAEGAIALPQTS